MAVNIELKRSAVPGRVPTTSSLNLGEIAINTYDGKAYFKRDDGSQSIVELASTSGSVATASFAVSASYATTASYSNTSTSASYALSASYAFNATSASHAVTASSADDFLVRGTLTAQTIVVQTITSSTEFVTGSTKFGSQLSNTHQFTGSVSITGSLGINGVDYEQTSASFDTRILNNSSSISYLSGSFLSASASFDTRITNNSASISYLSSSYLASSASFDTRITNNSSSISYLSSSYLASSASFDTRITNNSASISALSQSFLAFTASYNTGSFIGSFTGSFSGSLNNLQGSSTYIPFFSSSQVLANSSMFQVGSASIAINQTNITTANPEALYVSQTHPTSINVISGKGNLNHYLQLNIFNTNQGISASSDIVATANNGDEFSNYIDMGINSELYSQNFIGGANDAYLYSIANNLHIGSAATGNQHLGLFVGGDDVEANNKLSLYPTNQHQMSGSLDVSGSVKAFSFTGSLLGTASFANNATSASYALTASYLEGYISPFPFTGSAIISGSLVVTGSTISTNGFTGSLLGTASFANNATSSSYALNSTSASYAFNATSASFASSGNGIFSGSFSGSFQGNGGGLTNISASSIIGLNLAQIASGSATASISPTTGFRVNTNTTITGSTVISGSLTVTGSTNLFGGTGNIFSANVDTMVFTGSLFQSGSIVVTGSISATNITSSLFGTASWANNAITASYILNAVSASFASTASFVQNAVSSSFASTASFVQNAVSSSFATSASFATQAANATSASYAATASYADNFIVAGTLTAQTIVVQTITSSTEFVTGSTKFGSQLSNTHQFTGSVSITGSLTVADGISNLTASNAVTASYAFNATSASHAENATTASYALVATSASYALSSSHAENATTASYALVATSASYAENATTSSYALNATSASYATNATTASYALTSSYVNHLRQTLVVSGALDLVPTTDPDPTGANLIDTYLFVSKSNTALGYDLYHRQNGNLVKWKWIEGGSLNTGILYGGVVTYSGSLVYVSSGSGIIVNYNANTGSEINPIVNYVNWNNITASVTNITSSQVTYLYIDSAGSLQQQQIPFTPQQYSTLLPLGGVGHFNYSTVSAFGGLRNTSYGQPEQINQFIDAFGPLKVSGYSLSGISNSLSVSVGSGTSFQHGGFYQNDPDFPSLYNSLSVATGSIVRCYISSSQTVFDTNNGTLYTTINPGFYNNIVTGVTSSLGNNIWTIQRVFSYAPTNTLYVYYGQSSYATLVAALDQLAADPFIEGQTKEFTTFIGYLVVKTNTTALTDSDNKIIGAGLFRSSGAGSGGGAVSVTALDDLSDVSITAPVNGQALIYNSGVWNNGTPSTASYALNATSASYAFNATSASYSSNATTASYALNATSASYAFNATSASYATTASYALNATSASYASNATTASYALEATSASYALNSTSASYALSASFASTASFVQNAISSSFATTASFAIQAENATSASFASTASFVQNAQSASYVLQAVSASFASTASYVLDAISSSFATTASFAIQAANATTASYVLQAVSASYASTASEVLGGTSNYLALWKTNTALSRSVFYQDPSNNNYVGLFTTAPTYSLDVLGTVRAQDDLYGLTKVYFPNLSTGIGNYNVVIWEPTAGQLYQVPTSSLSVATASYVLNAVSASFATQAANAATASYVLNAISASYAATASSADDFLVRGTLTAQTIVVQTVTSSIVYSSGSNIFGSQLTDVQQMTGSLRVTGSGPHYILGGNVGFNNAYPSYSIDSAGVINSNAFLPYLGFSTPVGRTFNYVTSFGSGNTINYPGTGTAGFQYNYFANNEFYTTAGGTSNLLVVGFRNQNYIRSTVSTVPFQMVAFNNRFEAHDANDLGTLGNLNTVNSSFNREATASPLGGVATAYHYTTQTRLRSGFYTATRWGNENLQVADTAASQASTITDYDFLLNTTNVGSSSGGPGTITNFYLLRHVTNIGATGTITNRWGLYFTDSSFTSYHAGNFLIGSNTSTGEKLQVTGDAKITANLTATGSIKFPSLSNTNQVNVVSYDTTTGQLYYQSTSSLSVTSASYAATASHASSGFTIGISQIQTATVASSIAGSNNLFTTATGSFSGAKYLYTVSNGANARTGEVMAVWNGGSVQFTDNSTLDIGSTTAVTASVSIVTAQAQFNVQTNTSGWTIKSQVTYL